MKNSSKNPEGISRRSLLASMGIGGLSFAIAAPAALAEPAAANTPAEPAEFGFSHYGKWTKDDAGLPCFDANLDRKPAPNSIFCHLMSSGTVGALADQWGNIKLISSEDGPVCVTPAAAGRTRSGMYAMLETGGQLYSFIYSELHGSKRIRFGASYVEYHGELVVGNQRLAVAQEVYSPPDRDRALHGQFTFRNTGKEPVKGTLRLQSDMFLRPGGSYKEWVSTLKPDCGAGFAIFRGAGRVLGDLYLIGETGWAGSSRLHCLTLSKQINLAPGESTTVPIMIGYGTQADVHERQTKLVRTTPASAHKAWADRLSSFKLKNLEPWMMDECKWSLGQLLSFEFYDPILDEHYLHLGGYDYFPDPDDPPNHLAYTVREALENALVISHFEPRLAKSTLRWIAQMQVKSGDIPKNYNYTANRTDIRYYETDSDTEIWFLMALGEYIEVTGDTAMLDDMLLWFPATLGKTSMWDHAKRAFQWITEGIGIGQHGLIHILDGDWNDYLASVGALGKGESVMNSGMAARAFDSLARIARGKGDNEFAAKSEKWRDNLRAAVSKAFDKEWFAGSYTDDGLPLSGHNDRLYLNSQSWAALGGCGTKDERRKALECASRECGTRIGMMLMSKAYPSPAPPDVSWCPIPAGEGENGGIWPQTIHWTVWAMAQEGLLDLALTEWTKGTLQNHSKEFPDVPYGIFNGPDCWSSKLAGSLEGWSQFELFNRLRPCPMCPMISWQAFAMLKIAEAKRTAGKG